MATRIKKFEKNLKQFTTNELVAYWFWLNEDIANTPDKMVTKDVYDGRYWHKETTRTEQAITTRLRKQKDNVTRELNSRGVSDIWAYNREHAKEIPTVKYG